MLTPGTSQDNIRGFFYRGNVNIGGGTREYSNGFVVDGVNNTWAEMGEPRQNFAMDAIQEFKVSTSNYKAEYGLATGGLLTVVTKSGTNQLHGSGLMFFRDAAITAEEFPQKVLDKQQNVPTAPTPDYHRYQYRRHGRRTDHPEPDAFLRRLRGNEGKPELHRERRGIWPQYEGDVHERAGRAGRTTSRSITSSRRRRACSSGGVRKTNTGRSSRPADGRRRARASTSACRGSRLVREPHVGAQWTHAERHPLPVRVFEVSGRAALQPRRLARRRLRGAASVLHAGVQLSIDAVGGCGNAQMGPEHRYEIKDDFSHLMQALGGSHQWKTGLRLQLHPVRRRYHEFAVRQLDVPEGRVVQPGGPDDVPDAVHRSRSRPTRTFRRRPSRRTCRTTGACATA